jgi:flagellar basal body-associated protein FliL
MARQLTPSSIGVILGSFLMILVAGAFAYIYLVMTKAEPVPDKTQSFQTSVLTTELNAASTTSVFLQTVPLRSVGQSDTGGVAYSKDELGKSDIGRPGK